MEISMQASIRITSNSHNNADILRSGREAGPKEIMTFHLTETTTQFRTLAEKIIWPLFLHGSSLFVESSLLARVILIRTSFSLISTTVPNRTIRISSTAETTGSTRADGKS
jgi:hypothetical protein